MMRSELLFLNFMTGERRKMYLFLLALIYIAFISLGLPGFAAWLRLAGHARRAWCAGVVYGDHFNDHFRWDGCIEPVFGQNDPKIWNQNRNGCQRISDRYCTVWIFLFFAVLDAGRFAVPYGLGAGAIDSALNNYVALHYKAKHMSWLHCFWGVGTVISPFIMGYALTNRTWNSGYRIIGFLQLAIAILLLLTLPVWNINKSATETAGKSVGLVGALKIKGVPFLLLGFFAYCALEATAMQWASTYFVEVKGISTERAATFAALFYIGITSGRFASGFITDKLGDQKMIRLGTGILICGILVLFLPIASYQAAFAAFLVIGFGCAPIYPCIIHSTPSNFGAENSGAIIGIQMASAYIGTTFIPPIFGILGNSIGFFILPLYLLVFVALMITMVEVTFRITKNRNSL